MTISSGRPLAIIAGGGSVPLHVAEAATAAGRKVVILGIEGEADARIADHPHSWLNWGQLGRLKRLLEEHGTQDIVLVGGVRSRPDFKRFRPDLGTIRLLPRLISMMASGDNTVLTGTIRIFEEWGYSVVGAHEVCPDLVAAPGVVAGPTPRSGDLDDIRLAIAAARGIGALDAGQAAVAMNGRVVALEASEGTDGMLERVTALRANGRLKSSGPAGVLAKCPKPQQDLRVDMPTIGPETVTGAAKAGLVGIAIESGRVMIADRTETERRTKEAGLFIFAVDREAAA